MRRLLLVAVAVAVLLVGAAGAVTLLVTPASADRPLGPPVVVGATGTPSPGSALSSSGVAPSPSAAETGDEPGEGSASEEATDPDHTSDDVVTVSPQPAQSVDEHGDNGSGGGDG
jgi:hypothetical protein